MQFSERYGYKPIREIIQKESINTNLKNSLWNTISECIFNEYSRPYLARANLISGSNLESFFKLLFHSYFKKRIDQIPYSIESTIAEIDTLFLKHTNGMKFTTLLRHVWIIFLSILMRKKVSPLY